MKFGILIQLAAPMAQVITKILTNPCRFRPPVWLAGVILLGHLVVCHSSSAASLYVSGVDVNGAPLPGGSLDPHYTVARDGTSAPYSQATALSTSFYWGDWVRPTTGQWLYTSNGSDDGSRGFYVFRTTFDLSGTDPSTARINGMWTCDNYGSILLNGTATGNIVPDSTFDRLWSFSINSGFTPGMNELEFRVYFPDGYDGLLVSQIALTTVPEPASDAILAFGLGAWGIRRFHHRAK